MSLRDICFAYDTTVSLRHIDLDIRKGECVTLEGDNGCGKTTLLKVLNGLIFPQQGEYRFCGQMINAAYLKDGKAARVFHQAVGYVFQDTAVQLFSGSVRDEIAFGPREMGLPEAKVQQRTADMLALLDIEHLADRAPYHLSGGEKKKVALAAVLSLNPQVLVLDEPMAALDRKSRAFLMAFLKNLKTSGKTLLIATHDEAVATELADRRIFMEEGQIVTP